MHPITNMLVSARQTLLTNGVANLSVAVAMPIQSNPLGSYWRCCSAESVDAVIAVPHNRNPQLLRYYQRDLQGWSENFEAVLGKLNA